MPPVTADRSAGQLIAELGRLVALDWPTVWAGVPRDTDERTSWCAGFAWRPLWAEHGLWVRTADGGRLHLAYDAPGAGVSRVDHMLWSVRARDTVENQRVVELTEARWSAHLTAATRVMGPPDEESLEPRRVAAWRIPANEAPVIELWLTLRPGSTHSGVTARAEIGLTCRAERQTS